MTPAKRSRAREPLLHFLAIGAVLWAASTFIGDDDAPRDDEIVVPAERVEQLAVLFEKTRMRPPTRAELDGLIDDWVREELAYREARVMRLDEGDAIVRRRLRQKLEFFFEDLAGQVDPTDDDLRAYLADHADRFRPPAHYDFDHVYFSADRREDPEADARALLAELRAGRAGALDTLGDGLMISAEQRDVAAFEVDARFGPRFSSSLDELEIGAWHGPLRSGYGAHLVVVHRRVEGALPTVEEVRDELEREWANVQRERALDGAYEALRGRYDVTIEWPDAGDARAAGSGAETNGDAKTDGDDGPGADTEPGERP